MPSPYTREDAERFLAIAATEARGRRRRRARDRRRRGRPADRHDRPDGASTASAAAARSATGPPPRRAGAARRRARSCCVRDWAHAELGLTELEILAHRDNRPSQRVAERAGFADTGATAAHGRPRCAAPARRRRATSVYVWRPLDVRRPQRAGARRARARRAPLPPPRARHAVPRRGEGSPRPPPTSTAARACDAPARLRGRARRRRLLPASCCCRSARALPAARAGRAAARRARRARDRPAAVPLDLALASVVARRQAKRMQLPGHPRAIAVFEAQQLPLAAALVERHPDAELWALAGPLPERRLRARPRRRRRPTPGVGADGGGSGSSPGRLGSERGL